ncbi:MAG: PrgI family protein [Patescibacteria group bacterium]
MEQFLVPQFIEVEPRVFGPITVRQFIISIVALMLIFVCYKLFDFWTFVVSTVLIFAIFGTIAFAKINGRPFHYFLLNVIETFKKPKLKVWDKSLTDQEIREILQRPVAVSSVRKIAPKKLMSSSHLEELSLVVNTGGIYKSIYEE